VRPTVPRHRRAEWPIGVDVYTRTRRRRLVWQQLRLVAPDPYMVAAVLFLIIVLLFAAAMHATSAGI
jgi:hypothetical protein